MKPIAWPDLLIPCFLLFALVVSFFNETWQARIWKTIVFVLVVAFFTIVLLAEQIWPPA